jgi:hypothetical protein
MLILDTVIMRIIAKTTIYSISIGSSYNVIRMNLIILLLLLSFKWIQVHGLWNIYTPFVLIAFLLYNLLSLDAVTSLSPISNKISQTTLSCIQLHDTIIYLDRIE